MSYQVHWNEGLFLQPHHFQRLQRGVFADLEKMRREASPYGYGLTEMEVSEPELENNLLRFRRLAGVMPCGTGFAFPENCTLPTLDLGATSSARGEVVTVLLCLPLWEEHGANCAAVGAGQSATAPGHYIVGEKPVRDENTGANEKTIGFRMLNFCFLFDTDVRSAMDVMPILRLRAAGGDRRGRYQLDHDFSGPCLHGKASARLYHTVTDVAHLLDGSRAELLTQVTRHEFAADTINGRSLVAVMRLGVLTRAAARLKPLLAAPRVTPFTWYLELVSVLADLSVLDPDAESRTDSDYEHDDLVPVFDALQDAIRKAIKPIPVPTAWRIEFTKTDACYSAQLTEAHIKTPSDYYLVIRTKQDAGAVAALLHDRNRFKLMPPSLLGKAWFGLELEKADDAPVHLNLPRGSRVYRLVRSTNPERWKDIEKEKCMTVWWAEHRQSDFELALHMTLPT